jgi:hypothetical protein
MKRYYLFLSAVIVCLLGGCASQAPDWFTHSPADPSTLYGAGIAEIGENGVITNDNQALQAATTRARNDVLLQLESSLETMRVDFSGGNSTFFETVAKELSADVLRNSRVENRELRGKKYYVQISYKIANTDRVIAESARNARLDAEDAVRSMEDALNRLKSR